MDESRKRSLTKCLLILTLVILAPGLAGATTGGAPMPWDTGLANLADNMTGPTARALIIIAIVVSGLAWAFTEHGTGGRRLSQIVFGAAIALGAVALLSALGITAAVI